MSRHTLASWTVLLLQLFASSLFQTSTCTHSPTGVASLHPRSANESSSNPPKLVFAHFIVGLTINYTQDTWNKDIQLAASHNIDAFALNVGLPSDWQMKQVQSAFEAAKKVKTASGSPFKLFLSLDMSVIQSAQDVTSWVTTICPLPAQLLINSRPLISTFSGEANFLGGKNLSDGWNRALKAPLAALNPPLDALFIPVWSSLDSTTTVSANPVVDGIMTWLSWPSGAEQMGNNVDIAFQKDAKSSQKLYMAGVSPCFYTHYSDKNFLFKSDDNLYITRWKQLIQMQPQPDFIEIISWNDVGESHNIAPMLGTKPANTNWIDGMDHSGWLKMSDYFIQWYKNGSPPEIKEDVLYFNYRPHSVTAVASSDSLPPPTNASVSVDAVYAAAFLTQNSNAREIQISVGGSQQKFSNLSFSSISTFTAPWSGDGGDVQVSMLDGNGKQLLKKTGAVPISNKIKTYNFNYAMETLSSPASTLRPTSMRFLLFSWIEEIDHFSLKTSSFIAIFATLFTLLS
ncbi:family 71 glycoside hydrolase [Melampsora americana]|nr:family 71 glycoside hydrolase [Melampsora americana]